MSMRNILTVVALAAGLALSSPSSAQFGVVIGGDSKGGSGGHKTKDCHGLFCLHVDGDTIEKVLSTKPQTIDTKVCVMKYNDVNGNGHQDFGEPGLANWSFTIVGPIGTVPMPPTGPGGACFTSQFPVGSYTATETAQSGWLPTTPGGQSQTFALVPGTDVTLTFGNHYNPTQIPGVVCVSKYNDLNGNGARDTGEPFLSGWLFTVKNASGAVVDFGTTNAQGVFCTTHPLPPGTATVSETLQSGWMSTDPGGAIPSKSMTVVAGATVYVVFGNQVPVPPAPKGKICVAKFDDLNGDGHYTSGDLPLAGWQFTIAGPSGPITLTTSAPTGSACTPVNLTLGTYVVTEVMQSGWTSTTPGGASPQRTVTVLAGPNGNTLQFGNIHALNGQICARKYHDLNANHQFDPGEPFLSNWTFSVTNASGTVVGTGTTDWQGFYCTPSNLSPGIYTVTETPQPWWVSTDPHGPPMNSPPWDKTVTLTAAHGAVVYFGNIKSGRLCVLKYNDLDGNGHQDAGEPPLSGWTFRTDYLNWGASTEEHVTTGSNGVACIDLPPGGGQNTTEILQPGWTNTDPIGTWPHKVYTIIAGQTTNVVMGNRQNNPQPGHVCVVKYNDLNHNGARDPGEWLIAGWHVTVKTASGSTVGTLITSANAPVCMDLPVGSYVAVETMQTGWRNSDPPGILSQKVFAIGNGQSLDVAFGNYQIPLP